MRISMSGACFAAALLLWAAAPASGQAWDTPMFLSTQPGEDIGLYFIKGENFGEAGDDNDWGLSAIWRQALNPNMGVRVGFIRSDAGDTEFLVGAETWGEIVPSGALPVDFNWMLGAGANLAEGATWLRIPIGAVIGRTFGTPGGLRFTPYVLPRGSLDVLAFDRDVVGPEGETTSTEFNLVTDVGLDLAFSERFRVRLGASLGDIDALGAGVAIRFAREVAVR